LTWQDELRRLDEELAAGRISADEYRVSRDRVLVEAANPAAQHQPGPAPQPPTESTQLIPPLNPRPIPQESPPPPQQPAELDRTQQVQPGWTVANKSSDDDADRTQAVPGAGFQHMGPPPMASPPGGFPQPPGMRQVPPWEEGFPPQWSGAELPASTPWSSGEFPVVGVGNEPWLKQGPEVFDKDGSKTGKIVAIVVAVVLLIGIGIGAYLIWGRDSGGQAGGTPGTSTQGRPTTTTSRPPDPMDIAKISGTEEPKSVARFADVKALNYLNPVEVAAYETAGATKSAVKIVRRRPGPRSPRWWTPS
jgi:hypothetical protein